MGGDKLTALKTVSLKAHLAQYDPGESYSVHDPDKPGVNSSELMTDMVTVSRAYEAAQKMVTTQDDLLNQSITSLGRVG